MLFSHPRPRKNFFFAYMARSSCIFFSLGRMSMARVHPVPNRPSKKLNREVCLRTAVSRRKIAILHVPSLTPKPSSGTFPPDFPPPLPLPLLLYLSCPLPIGLSTDLISTEGQAFKLLPNRENIIKRVPRAKFVHLSSETKSGIHRQFKPRSRFSIFFYF